MNRRLSKILGIALMGHFVLAFVAAAAVAGEHKNATSKDVDASTFVATEVGARNGVT